MGHVAPAVLVFGMKLSDAGQPLVKIERWLGDLFGKRELGQRAVVLVGPTSGVYAHQVCHGVHFSLNPTRLVVDDFPIANEAGEEDRGKQVEIHWDALSAQLGYTTE